MMSFCFQLGHSSVALTPERSVASCPRRWMTGMTGYLGRWVPSVIFYVHFSFWLTAFIQNVISHHLYEIKICCLNNISFQNLSSNFIIVFEILNHIFFHVINPSFFLLMNMQVKTKFTICIFMFFKAEKILISRNTKHVRRFISCL